MSLLGAFGPLSVDPRMGAPGLRWGMLALALAWAALAWRGRRWSTLLGGLLFTGVLLGFWATTLGRPYGSSGTTPVSREAAFAVRAALAPPLEGFVVGRPFEGGRWARLAQLGLPVEGLLAWPTWLPLLVVAASAVAVALIWRSRVATWGAALWLAFSTSDLEALGEGGFLDGLWAHPAGALAFLAAVTGALLLGRRGGASTSAAGGLLLALAGWLAWPALEAPTETGRWVRASLIDSWPWPVLAALGLRRQADPAARWCLGLGLLGGLAGLGGLAVDAWAARAVWRLGLVLSAAPVLEHWCGLLAERLAGGRFPLSPGSGLSLLLLIAVPGSFPTTWNPYDLDATAESSAEPVPPGVAQATAWMRAHLPADAVVVASAAYAPAVVIQGQRRVLRAPGLDAAPDDLRRMRLERALFENSAAGRQSAQRYGVTHVLVGPGDARRWGFDEPAHAARPSRLRPLASPAPGFTVYALAGW